MSHLTFALRALGSKKAVFLMYHHVSLKSLLRDRFDPLLHSKVIPDLQKNSKEWVEGSPEEDFSCSKDFKWSWRCCRFVTSGVPLAGQRIHWFNWFIFARSSSMHEASNAPSPISFSFWEEIGPVKNLSCKVVGVFFFCQHVPNMFFISGKSTEGGPEFAPKRRKALQTLGCSFRKTWCKVKFLSSALVQLINCISCIYSQRSNW